MVKIIEAFENPNWIGQLKERWKEIKKLQAGSTHSKVLS